MIRLLIRGIGAVVAVGFIVGSAVANFMFGTTLGRTAAESILIGSIGVCAVATNALCPFFVSWALQASRKAAAASILPLYALCLLYSVTSAVGFVAQNREGVSSSRQLSRDAYEDTRRELLDLERRRGIAKNKDRARLDARVDEVRKRLSKLRTAPAAPADAQSVFLSALTFGWVDAQHIRIALATLFGLMVEVGATVGLFAALSHPSKKPATTLAVGRWRPRIG